MFHAVVCFLQCDGAYRYGPNVFPEPPFAGFWALFFESFQDPILIILIIAAAVSFIVGLINHPTDGWIDGVAIVIAILLVSTSAVCQGCSL
jgi:magnesium-transporting ATPase (P-type)